MAITEIQAGVENITGVSPSADRINDAQKFVSSSIPKNLMWAYASKTTGVTSNPVTNNSTLIHTDNILGVDRDGFSAQQVGFEQKGFINSTASLHKATKTYPKWYIAETNEVNIFPPPEAGEEGTVLYVNYGNIADTSDLRNAVIFRACSSEFTRLSVLKIIDWTDLVLPTPPSAPDFGDDISLAISVPTAPTLTTSSVDTSGWGSIPTYTQPLISFTSFPSLSWELPVKPVVPNLSTVTVDSLTASQPSYTPPTMNAPDFADANTHMTAEDTELVQARLGIINAQVAEYGAKMNEAQSQFNKENAIYQATIQELIQEAQLRESSEARKLQKFQSEQALYQGEVQKTVSSNQGQIGEWQQRNALSLQEFSAKIQSELNVFNQENVEYQANLAKSVQDAQLHSQDDGQSIQKFGAEVQSYQQQINSAVQEYQTTLSKNTQEFQSEVGLFNSKLQKFQNEVGEKTQKFTTSSAQSGLYAQLAEKYYNWSIMEVTSFTKNNSKMIDKTMAQAAQQQRR